jgi:hypothetical protein
VILVVKLDVCAVLGSNGYVGHQGGPFEGSESGSGQNAQSRARHSLL